MGLSTLFLVLVVVAYSGALTKVVQKPVGDTFCEGTDATLNCTIFDNSTSRIANNTFWSNLTSNGNVPDDLFSNNRDGDYVTSILTIMDVSLYENNTNYLCRASSEVQSSAAVIIVIVPPMTAPIITKPTNLTSSLLFTISWTIANPSDIRSYIITWTNLRTDDMNTTVLENTGSYEVTGLNGVDNYNVSVTAENPCGVIESDPVTVYDKPNPPMNVTIPPEDIKTDSFVVQWDAVTDIFSITYTVRWYGEDINDTATTNGLSYTITRLTSNTSYSVTVVAINTCCGAGPVSDVVMAITNSASPPTDPVVSKNGGENDLNVGLIVGITVPIVVVVLAIIGIVCWWKASQVPSEKYLNVTYEEQSYNLLEIPLESDTLVMKKINENEERLKLDHLREDLSSLVRFLEFAYLGMIMYPHLLNSCWKCLLKFIELFHKTKETLNIFVGNSEEAVNGLNQVYEYLKDNEEALALKKLRKLPEMSDKMTDELQSLLENWKKQSEVIERVRDDVLCEFKHNIKEKMEKLQEESQLQKELIAPNKEETEKNYLDQIQEQKSIIGEMWYEIMKQENPYNKDKAKIQDATTRSLNIAIRLLSDIQIRMNKVDSCWKEIRGLFKSMGGSMNSQIEMLSESEFQQCKRNLQTNTFKKNSLMFYVKWIALKKIFTKVNEHVCYIIYGEVQEYVKENHDKDKTVKCIEDKIKKSFSTRHNLPSIMSS